MTRIFCFSGTGNSLAVAKHLAEDLGGAEVAPVSRAMKQAVTGDADCIGIVFPVYAWGLPLMVAEFAKKFRAPSSAYVFAVATYGGFPGGTLLQLRDILAANGVRLSAGFGVTMPGNYIVLYDIKPAERVGKTLGNERARTKEIAAAVKERKPGRIAANNFLVNALFTNLIYKGFSRHVRAADKSYRATDKCNGCGICASVCPAENIRMANGRPEWQHKCEQCVACLHWCPTEAIEFGKRTEGRKRYHHPDMTTKAFIAAAR